MPLPMTVTSFPAFRSGLSALATVAFTLVAPLASAESLMLYTSQPNTDAQQTVDAFEKAHPEIEVQWVRDGTTRLMTRLEAERAAGQHRADVLLVADAVSLENLRQQDLLAQYQPEALEHYPDALYDPEGYYFGTKQIATGIVHHQRAAEQPQRWQDLTEPAYKGQVAMPSPLYSGAALIHLDSMVNDERFGWAYYQALADNGVTPNGGNGGVLKQVAAGTKPYGVMVDFMALREKAKGSPIEFVYPEEGVSVVTEPVAIMKGAQHVEAARKFVEFLLSREGQQLVSQQGYLPARDDVSAPEGYPDREQIKPLPFSATRALEQAEAEKARFADIFSS
ncbi:ABC transporter substrate-binding protein [Kushneria pakistanensis]|nr:ABC transporter substrate-binding protein [Kushneria pakistanensis]